MTEGELRGAQHRIDPDTGDVIIRTTKGDRYRVSRDTLLQLFRYALVLGFRTGQITREGRCDG